MPEKHTLVTGGGGAVEFCAEMMALIRRRATAASRVRVIALVRALSKAVVALCRRRGSARLFEDCSKTAGAHGSQVIHGPRGEKKAHPTRPVCPIIGQNRARTGLQTKHARTHDDGADNNDDDCSVCMCVCSRNAKRTHTCVRVDPRSSGGCGAVAVTFR